MDIKGRLGRWGGALVALAAMWTGSAAALECRPVASLNYNLTEQWNNMPADQSPVLCTIKRVTSRQNFNVYIILDKVTIKGGNCKVLADLEIVRPDGKVCFAGRDIVALSGIVSVPAGHNSFLSPQFVKVRLEDADPLGKYTIKLTTKDVLSKQTATGEAAVELVSAREDLMAVDFTDPQSQQLMTYYYLQPEPEELVPLFLGYCKYYRDVLRKDGKHNPLTVLTFFYRAFDLNRQLIPPLAAAAHELDPIGKNFTIMLLYYLGVKEEKYYDEIGKAQAAGFRKILAVQPNPFEFDFPVMPLQLDMLWANFFVTGDFDPIRKIVMAIGEIRRGMSPEQFKAVKKPTNADQMKLSHWLVGYAAKWSLGANVRQHPLVRAYLEWLVKSPDLKNDFVRQQIQEILTTTAAPAPVKK